MSVHGVNSDYEAQKNKRGLFLSRLLAYVVLILIAVISLFPFYILIVNATRGHADIQKGFSLLPGVFALQNIESALGNPVMPLLTGIANSLLISTCVAVLSCYFSALTAYALHAYDFKLKNAAFTFIMAVMIIPTQVSATGFIRMVDNMGLMDSAIPLIIPSIAAPAVFFYMRQYMTANLPMEIVEAARIDGSGEFSTFNRIVLPIMKPALAVQAIMTFVGAWNNYFTPALILESTHKKTLPIVIAQMRSADFVKFDMGQLYMGIAIAIVPIAVVYFILSKYIIGGVAAGSVKG